MVNYFNGYFLGIRICVTCNFFFQVKVKNWVDNVEGESFSGLTARFGSLLPSDVEKGHKLTAVFANPANCCSNSSSKVVHWFCFVELAKIYFFHCYLVR